VENAAWVAAQLLNNARAAQEGRAMSKMTGKRTLTAILSITAIAAALSIGSGFGVGKAFAGDTVTEDQILKALAPAPKPLTRGLSIGPQTQTDPAPSADESKFVQTIRGRATRSLSSAEREEIAAIAKTKPNIDLEITFDYNSANISQKSMPSVQALGRALTSPDLKGSTFIVAGHTDAAGTEVYNQDLSERRADSIKRYLVDKYSIAGADLVSVGYGKSKLKDPGQPLAEVNRRVQVVNMENKTTAAK
jgi:outer membrane protein OmpA-like peptidoglycan-associated protein